MRAPETALVLFCPVRHPVGIRSRIQGLQPGKSIILYRSVRRTIFVVSLLAFLVPVPVHAQGAEFSFHGGQAVEEYERGGGGSVIVNLPTGIRTIHVGARATYHLTSTMDDGEKSLLLYGVDAGVTLVSSPILVRAMIGVGRAQDAEETVIVEDDTRTDITRTTNTYYAQPGVMIGMSLGIVFVGLEGRYISLDKGVSTTAVYATVGFKVGH